MHFFLLVLFVNLLHGRIRAGVRNGAQEFSARCWKVFVPVADAQEINCFFLLLFSFLMKSNRFFHIPFDVILLVCIEAICHAIIRSIQGIEFSLTLTSKNVFDDNFLFFFQLWEHNRKVILNEWQDSDPLSRFRVNFNVIYLPAVINALNVDRWKAAQTTAASCHSKIQRLLK